MIKAKVKESKVAGFSKCNRLTKSYGFETERNKSCGTSQVELNSARLEYKLLSESDVNITNRKNSGDSGGISRRTLKASIEERLTQACKPDLEKYYELRKRKTSQNISLGSLSERTTLVMKPGLNSTVKKVTKNEATVFFLNNPQFKFSSHFNLQKKPPTKMKKPSPALGIPSITRINLASTSAFLSSLKSKGGIQARTTLPSRSKLATPFLKRTPAGSFVTSQTARHFENRVPAYIEIKDRVMKMTVATSKKDKSRQKPCLLLRAIKELKLGSHQNSKNIPCIFPSSPAPLSLIRHRPSYHTSNIVLDHPNMRDQRGTAYLGQEIPDRIHLAGPPNLAAPSIPDKTSYPSNFFSARYAAKHHWKRSRVKLRQPETNIDRCSVNDIKMN